MEIHNLRDNSIQNINDMFQSYYDREIVYQNEINTVNDKLTISKKVHDKLMKEISDKDKYISVLSNTIKDYEDQIKTLTAN